MEQQLSNIEEEYIEKLNLMAAVCSNEAGISFLQWLFRLTGYGRPSMSMEDAARRDVWLSVQRFIPVERLSEIEHHDLRRQQRSGHEMIEAIMELKKLEEMHDE